MKALALLLALAPIAAATAHAQPIRDDLWVTNGSVEATTIVGNTLYLGGQFSRVGPSTGGLMPVDPASGLRLRPSLGLNGAVYAITPDGAGGHYIGGTFTSLQGQPRAGLARIDAAGDLLPWNPGTNGIVRALLVTGGKVYVGGSFTQVGGLTRMNLAAIDTNGTVTSWNPGTNDVVHALATSGGLLYVGGEFFEIAGTQRAYGAALSLTTGAATSFQPNADDDIYAIAVRYDVINLTTTVYFGGRFTVIGGAFRKNFAIVDATVGSATYSTALNWAPEPNGAVRKILVFGNTVPTIYLGGDFTIIAGQARGRLARFSGTTLSTWNPDANNGVSTLHLDGSTLYVGGWFSSIAGQTRVYAAAVNTSTGAATSWDAGANDIVYAMGKTGNQLWLGGIFTSVNSLPRANLAALDLDYGIATPWNPGTNGPVYAITSIGGRLYVGGTFNVVGGQARAHVAQLGTDGSVGAWNPGTNNTVSAIVGRSTGATSNLIYLGGKFTSCFGQARGRLAAVTDDPVSPTLTGWNPNVNGDISDLLVDATHVYAGGTFTNLSGQPFLNLAKIDFVGFPAPWFPSPQAPVRALADNGSTIYVGLLSPSALIGGATRHGAGEVLKSNGAATAWDPYANGPVYTIRRIGDVVYLGGSFANVGGQPRRNLAAVDANTSGVLDFNPSPTSYAVVLSLGAPVSGVLDLIEADGRLYCAGLFKLAGGKPHSGIAGIFRETTSIEPGPSASRLALRAWPNPAAAGQTLQFEIPFSSGVRLEVLDVAGRLVRVLSHEVLPAGPQRIEWDGRTDAGSRVAPGIYFLRLRAGEASATTKVVRTS